MPFWLLSPGLGWAGLGWAGLGWLGWAGLGWAGLGWAGRGGKGFNQGSAGGVSLTATRRMAGGCGVTRRLQQLGLLHPARSDWMAQSEVMTDCG